jgi:hypothetical protein
MLSEEAPAEDGAGGAELEPEDLGPSFEVGPGAQAGWWSRAFPALVVVVTGLLLQARTESPALWAGPSDAAKYLALARAAPGRALYDGHAYLIHPPLHPLAIRALALLPGVDLATAGALLGSLCVVGLALVVTLLARRLLGLSPWTCAVAGLALLASRGAAFLGQGVWREPGQTLLVFGLLLLAARPGSSRARLLAAGALGLLMGLTWDPLVLLVPFLLVGGWLLRRPPLLAAGVVLAVTWMGWAGWRWQALTRAPAYPAGIDGVWEDSTQAGPGAFFNPNLLANTARHNEYFWPRELTLERPLQAAAPWFSAPERPYLTLLEVPGTVRAGALAVLCLALVGLVCLVRGPPPPQGWGPLVVLALAAGLLGGPGLVGGQARYGFALLPALALLTACAAEGALARVASSSSSRDRAARGVVLVACALILVGWWAGRPSWTWGRPQLYEGRAVVAGLARCPDDLVAGDWALAAPVGLTPDLCWTLPERRIVTLPFAAEGLWELLERRGVRLVVLPHETFRTERLGVDPAAADLAHGLPMVRAIHAAARDGRLTHLGTALEAEVTDAPRARAYDLFWVGPPADAPAGFGVLLEPGAEDALAQALATGAASPETRRLAGLLTSD